MIAVAVILALFVAALILGLLGKETWRDTRPLVAMHPEWVSWFAFAATLALAVLACYAVTLWS